MEQSKELQKATSNARIAYLSSCNNAKKYLEIGVFGGGTFFPVTIPFKVAVDPHFRFNFLEHKESGTHFFQLSSDEFFKKLDNNDPAFEDVFIQKPFAFDVIFIDGLHTFEQSYRDFCNSLRYAHDKTLWLFDDTVPSDAYSAMPDMEASYRERVRAEKRDCPWHGDVYKTIFAIHDFHPDISYCTLIGGNPQTVCWKSNASSREHAFSSIEEIDSLSYSDLLRHAKMMMPIIDTDLPEYIFHSLNPSVDAAFDSKTRLLTGRGSLLSRISYKFKAEGLGGIVKAVVARAGRA